MTFCTQLVAAVTRLTFAPRRTPLIPIGSRMPSWLSTMYSRGKHVEDLAVGVDRDGARAFEDALDVGAGDLAAGDGGDAVGAWRADVAAGDAGVDRADLDAGHRLRGVDRVADRAHRPVDVATRRPCAGRGKGRCRRRGW